MAETFSPYEFKSPIDPRKSLDPADPPPAGWVSVSDYVRAATLWGMVNLEYEKIQHWERRELGRYKMLKTTA